MIEVIASHLPESTREAARIELTVDKGFRFLGVRIWTEHGGATARGLTLRAESFPELVKALQAAETIARSAGLL